MEPHQRYDELTLGFRNSLFSKLRELAISSGNKTVQEIISYVIYPGRKLYCSMLALGAYKASGGKDAPVANDIVLFSELLNLGWLVVDDIIDDHKIRFNKTSAKGKFGTGKTLLAALYLISAGYGVVGKYKIKSLSKINTTYSGWLERDLVRGKSLADCEKSLRELGSYYGAFAKIAAEIAGASAPHQEQIEAFGTEIGYALTLMAECSDLRGETFRPAAEELRQGNDVLIAIKALEDDIDIRNQKNPWHELKGTRAHKYVISQLTKTLNKAKTILDKIEDGNENSILSAIFFVSNDKLSELNSP